MELEPMSEDDVKSLIKKADEASNALDAMQYTQAAVNAANALRVLVDTKEVEKMLN
jgi:hypothetical protein